MESKKYILQGAKSKVPYITRG